MGEMHSATPVAAPDLGDAHDQELLGRLARRHSCAVDSR